MKRHASNQRCSWPFRLESFGTAVRKEDDKQVAPPPMEKVPIGIPPKTDILSALRGKKVLAHEVA